MHGCSVPKSDYSSRSSACTHASISAMKMAHAHAPPLTPGILALPLFFGSLFSQQFPAVVELEEEATRELALEGKEITYVS